MTSSFLLTLLALALAWQAQVMLAGPRPQDGWALYPAAMALFGLALRERRFAHVAGGRLAELVPPQVWPHSRSFWVLGAASMLCALLALIAFLFPAGLGWGWALHGASILLLIAAFVVTTWVTRSYPIKTTLAVTRRWEWGALAPILAYALAVRVWQVGSMPEGLMGDEALYGMVARRILHEPGYVPLVYMEYIQRLPHFAYLVALAFQWFGDGAASLRLVPALFGVAGIAVAYVFFKRWFGGRAYAGLLAAGLLAAMRYDLTFSRIAIDGISTPFFVMLTLLFLDRGLERKRPVDFAAAGMTMGFGLQFYLPIRIFILLLIAIGLVFVLVATLHDGRAWSQIRGAWRRRVWPYWPHMLCLAIGLFVAAGPLAEDALREPDVFFERHYSASIFFEPEEPDFVKRLWNNTSRHLAMFNGTGDHYGRDNLPGAPMLDAVLGVFFLLGVGLSLARWHDSANGLMLALFGGMLLAGVLSWDKEAPDALRVIGVLPAIVYFIVLALVALVEAARRWCAEWLPSSANQLVRPALTIGCAALLLFVAWNDGDVYFNRQIPNTDVWAAHDIGASWIGREMARLGPQYDYRIAPVYFGRPTIEYFAPGIASTEWRDDDRIKGIATSRRPVVLFLDYWHRAIVDDARLLNAAVPVQELSPPQGGLTYVYEVILELDTLRRAQRP